MMGVSLFFRLPLLEESLWVDELHTAWVVADSPQEIPERAAMGNQSPLYFLGVWAWLQTSGMHEWSLRLPSLLAGVLAVGLVTVITHRWTKDGWIALGIGLIAAMDKDWIFFATEARTYALVQAVAIAQVIVAWQACQHDRVAAWLGLISLSLINFYLHYSTLLFTGGVGLAMLISAANRPVRKHLLLAGIVLLLGIGVSVPHLLSIFERRANWAQFISATSSNEWTRWGTVFAFLIPASIALLIAWLRQTAIPQLQKRRFFFLTLVVLLPLATAWLTTATGVAALFFGRYLFSVEACVLLLLASIVAMLPGKWVARGVLALAVLLSFFGRFHSPWQGMRGENWPQVVQAASDRINSLDLPPEIVIAAGLIETDILLTDEAEDQPWDEFARLPLESIYRLPAQATERFGLTYTNAGQPTPRYQAESADQATVILIVRGRDSKADQVARRLQAAFPERDYRIETPQPQTYGVQWRVLTPQASSP
ncbi:hypothetical protein DTL42_12015 [Bremerella cremea]|uniref:Glycosyltransferase RgtA/B/C/D-like domain-containing protein n=2 Tax=Bremerella cremea TaxID=1031537 RepID=A0A368KR20_9BACT|nr:hypothetical protein DTL42_12015 [Bremerella cremea]